jgi:hypothetical protein
MRLRFSCPLDAAIGLALFGLLLVYFQCSTLSKCSVLSPAMSYGGLIDYARQLRWKAGLDWADALPFALLLLVLLALLAGEWRWHRLSRFLAWALASEQRTLALMGLSSLVSVRFYFTPGELGWGGDASFHLTYAELAASAIGRGELPIWTNAFGAGSPYLQFYGFLFYYLTGLVNLLCRDLNISLKLVLAGTHVASGLGMYYLVRTLCRSRRAGLVGGLAYVLCFWHTQQVVIMGRLPLGLFYALLPWPFYCFERLRSSSRSLSLVALGGLALGALALTHPGYGMWATLFFPLYCAQRLAAHPRERTRWGQAGLALLGLGLLFGAYLTLPMWLDRGLTGLAGGVDLSGVPDPSWHHLLVWSNYRFWLLPLPESARHWHGGYLGLSLIGLAGAGLWLAHRRFPRRGVAQTCWAVVACLGLTLLLVFGYRWPLLGQLPLVYLFNASRYLLFTTFFLAAAAGLGAKLLLNWRLLGRRSSGLFFLVLLGMLADLGPTTFQHPCMSADNDPLGYSQAVYERIGKLGRPFADQGQLPNYRALWALGPTHPFLGLGWLYHRGLTPLAQGFQAAELPAAVEQIGPFSRYVAEVWKNASGAELPNLPDYPFVARSLAALNVRFLLYTRADHDLAWPAGQFPHTPVLVSARAKGYRQEELARRWSRPEVEQQLQKTVVSADFMPTARQMVAVIWAAETMQADPANRTCQSLPLLEWQGPEYLGALPQVELLEHRVWDQRAELRLRLDAPAYARLAYAYYPYLAVEVDGQRVAPFQTVDHFIALKLDAGEHKVVLTPYLSPLRRALLLLDAFLLAAAIWVWLHRH